MAKVSVSKNERYGQMYIECSDPYVNVRISSNSRQHNARAFCQLAGIEYGDGIYNGEDADRILSVVNKLQPHHGR